ncbi:inositol monophosphatase [Magnetospira sp. QH-2]|uniref:inositol monophosphatase family protein n=1 Tax=Magnetospira sp. (strain QH-2) TaxID=1288970 RepID=UPI0003E81513|nr:inositol monophosphatase [Magnetospira sp. QH-2]CCQ73793.1 Inositol-1-monophosphatase [Magnetospira sp. QH-2]
MIPDPAKVLRIIKEVGHQEVLSRYKKLSKLDIQAKTSPHDLVTVADTLAEVSLRDKLTKLLPNSVVMGEEGVAADPAELGLLSGEAPVWVLDPVDGTNNYAQGRPNFAMIVALCHGGETIAGWIHRPLQDRSVWAIKGRGAWRDDRRLTIQTHRSLEGQRAAMNRHIGREIQIKANRGRSGLPRVVPRMFCAGCEYMALVEGDLEIVQYDRLKPWDHAAGILIHREAGGFDGMTTDGQPYRPGGPLAGQLVVAPDETSWKSLSAVLAEG